MDLMAALKFGNDTFTLILWKFGQSISLSTAFGWSCNLKLLGLILLAAAFIYLHHRHDGKQFVLKCLSFIFLFSLVLLEIW
jgi:hypothetical protein